MENNLKAVVRSIESTSKSVDPTVGTFFYGDIYNINHIQEIKYPAIIVTNGTHTATSDYITYYFNIFYVDRLTANKSNKLEVQSAAIMTLKNTNQLLDEQFIVNDNYEFHTFEEKFNDVCAGAYVTVGVKCPVQACDALWSEPVDPPIPPKPEPEDDQKVTVTFKSLRRDIVLAEYGHFLEAVPAAFGFNRNDFEIWADAYIYDDYLLPYYYDFGATYYHQIQYSLYKDAVEKLKQDYPNYQLEFDYDIAQEPVTDDAIVYPIIRLVNVPYISQSKVVYIKQLRECFTGLGLSDAQKWVNSIVNNGYPQMTDKWTGTYLQYKLAVQEFGTKYPESAAVFDYEIVK